MTTARANVTGRVVAAVVLLALTACGQSPSHATAKGQKTQNAILQPADLPPGTHLVLYRNGDQLAGQVSLDNCGFTFASENHRRARREYALLSGQDHSTGLAQETIEYDSPNAAADALREWRKSVQTCPKTPTVTRSGIHGTFKVLAAGTNSTALPVADNALTSERLTVPAGTVYLFAVLQRQGAVLSIIYYTSPVRVEQIEQAVTVRVAVNAGRRLAAAVR